MVVYKEATLPDLPGILVLNYSSYLTRIMLDSSAMGECGGRGIPSFIMVSCAMFTKVCAAHINYLKVSCLLLYPLTV